MHMLIARALYTPSCCLLVNDHTKARVNLDVMAMIYLHYVQIDV
jgi:hypothetical protein